MPHDNTRKQTSILLGRPFLKTARFKLDAFAGTFSFSNKENVVTFSIHDRRRTPFPPHTLLQYDIIDELVAEIDQPEKEESGNNEDAVKQLSNELKLEKEASHTLKPLPPHLKYAFLGKNEELP
ncbi:hypothetical protein PIB30_082719, partial [Stylosanthes scabra]|nr:hypothetical protein [Stylosanthes scabra]